MAAVTKFLFEDSFDAPLVEEGEPPPAEDPAEAEKRRIESEFAAARAVAYAEGLEEGRRAGYAAAQADIEGQAARAIEAIAQDLAALDRSQAQAAEAMMETGMELVATIARRTMPVLAQRHGLAEIEALVADCLGQLVEEPRVVIRVRDSLLDPLQRHAQAIARAAGFEGKLVTVADPALGDSDCRVEWADGGVVRNVTRVMAELDDAIARALGKQGTEPKPEADSPQPSPMHS